MYEYWCWWSAPCSNYRRKVIVDSLHEVKDGFWVDRDFDYTKSDSGMYWIPPAGIKVVEKVKVDK